MDDEGYEHTYQTLVMPRDEVTSKITHITGITQEMVDTAPSLKESMVKLIEFIEIHFCNLLLTKI